MAATRDMIKNIAEGVMYNIVPYGIMKYVPQGFDLFYDLKKIHPDYYPSVVFDVGANIGQTVLKWNKFFPKATYHCFEPVKGTFDTLKRNTTSLTNVTYHHCALGAETKKETITLFEDSRMNTLQESKGDPDRKLGIEEIKIFRVDEICEAHGIKKIDFMKIDTEGFDIEVLKGSQSMLKNFGISFIQVEAGMNPYNTRHAPFHKIEEFLASYGYVLFGIYGQHLEWNGTKRLRMSNPVFISPEFK
jgi:FkbM family methyltransferase